MNMYELKSFVGAKERQKESDSSTTALLILIISSWFLFPIMLKFLAYREFQVAFFVISIVVLVKLIWHSKVNQLKWLRWHKWFMFFWAIYLLSLLSSTLYSDSLYSLKQYCITIYKVMFFWVLLLYMKRNIVIRSFQAYSFLVLVIVFLASLTAISIKFDLVTPIESLTQKVTQHTQYFQVYWGAYYFDGHRRMQGFCEESGTFALTILPAVFWFLIVAKSYVRTALVLIGVFASHSTGGLWEMALAILLSAKKKVFSKNILFCLLVLTCILAVILGLPYLEALFSSEPLAFRHKIEAFVSLPGRLQSILSSYEYLTVHPFGTGSALGMITVNYPISVGYANAMLESGVIGGLAYLLMFGVLGWQALKFSLAANINDNEGKVNFVVALTVMIILLMGFQRQQPDLSMWHMWIYASFFYITMKHENNKKDV